MGERSAVGRLSLLPEGEKQLLDGRYQLIGEIASGGMASVFLARRAGVGGFQRLVAIKRLHPHLAKEQEFVDMFLDEARLAASIHHRNVVPILEIGASDTGYYLVMEYIEGVTLAKLMTHAAVVKNPVPDDILLRMAVDALGGLHAAHELMDDTGEPLGVVHRDCSPQNLLIGLDGCTRITDFGIARARSRLHNTREGAMKGKLAYMAPEQTQGDEFDRRADIFSVGVVMWEMLAQRRLFKGKTEAQTLKRLLHDPIPGVRKYVPSIPEALDEVCLRALARDPAKRFATAADMADAIEAAAKGNIGVATDRQVEALMKERYGADATEQRDAVRTWLQATPTTVGPRGPTTDPGWAGPERSAVETRPPPASGKQVLPATRREGSDRPPKPLPPPTRGRRNVTTRREGSGAPPASAAPPPSSDGLAHSSAPPASSARGALSTATPRAGTLPATARTWPPEERAPVASSVPPPRQPVRRLPPARTLQSEQYVESTIEREAPDDATVIRPQSSQSVNRDGLGDESNDETHIYDASSTRGVATDRPLPPPQAPPEPAVVVPVEPSNKSRWPLLVAAVFALITAGLLVMRTTQGSGEPEPVDDGQVAEETSPSQASDRPSEGDDRPDPPGDRDDEPKAEPTEPPASSPHPQRPPQGATPSPAVAPQLAPKPDPDPEPKTDDPPDPPEPPPPPKPTGPDESDDLSNPYR